MAKRVTKKQISADQLNSEIQRRAYEIFESRSGMDGDHFTDWIQAEKEVKKNFKIK